MSVPGSGMVCVGLGDYRSDWTRLGCVRSRSADHIENYPLVTVSVRTTVRMFSSPAAGPSAGPAGPHRHARGRDASERAEPGSGRPDRGQSRRAQGQCADPQHQAKETDRPRWDFDRVMLAYLRIGGGVAARREHAASQQQHAAAASAGLIRPPGRWCHFPGVSELAEAHGTRTVRECSVHFYYDLRLIRILQLHRYPEPPRAHIP